VGFQRLRKCILGIAPGKTLGHQFRLRCFLGACSYPRLGLQSSDRLQCLSLGQTFMAKFRLEITDHCLRLLQEPLCTVSRRCL
jgi:hypothetical protein